MDFQLSEDQHALRSGLRDFCDDRYGFENIVALEKTPLDRARWSELAEMGVFSLRLPEAQGGVGLGMAESVLVFAELGRRVVPGPLLWSHLLAGLVPGAATGETIVGGLDRTRASSEPLLVEYAGGLDALVVLAKDGVHRIEARKLAGTPVGTPLDPLTPLTHVRELPKGERIAGPEQAAQLRLEGALLSSALCLGITEMTAELAVEYAKKREQFDRPIGSFQAIKHPLVNVLIAVEQLRTLSYAAASALDAGDAEAEGLARMAKAAASEAYPFACSRAVQFHGGYGFTEDCDAHLYLRRALASRPALGDGREHRAAIAASLLDGERATSASRPRP